MDLKPMHLPLELVLNIITCSLPKYSNVLLPPSHPITQTLISFTLVCHETRRVANRYLLRHCVYLSSRNRLRSFLLEIPSRHVLRQTSALFLAPFAETIDDQPVAHWVRELFNFTASSLKRLVIDIPLRSVYPEEDHLNVRHILRQGFLSLENLEELVSVRDELYLDTAQNSGENKAWESWPNLRRLALYNVDADSIFWCKAASMPKLENIVLTRADSLHIRDIKTWCCPYSKGRTIKVLLVNVASEQARFSRIQRVRWDQVDPNKKLTVVTYNVPTLYADEDPIEVCQDFVRSGAENGTIWGWEGEVIQHPLKIAR